MFPATSSPFTIGTWPDTYSQPSASTARANGRCCPPVPLPPSTPYRLIVISVPFRHGPSLNPRRLCARQKAPGAGSRRSIRGIRQHSVDPHAHDALCRPHRISKCRLVDDLLGIKENQISTIAFANHPPLCESKPLRRH